MAVEWGSACIRVNAVAPGTIIMPRSAQRPDMVQRERCIPRGRRGVPNETADPVVFLLSAAASFITGQPLVVDGGVTARSGYLDEDQVPIFLINPEMRRGLRLDGS